MKIVAYPTEYDEQEGITPIEIRDIYLVTNPKELRVLASYLADMASWLEAGKVTTRTLELQSTDPNYAVEFTVQSE